MESAVCVSGFLLLLCSTGVRLSPHLKQEFGHKGGDVEFDPSFSSVDDHVLYRVWGDGDLLLLINCSQPERPQPDEYEVRCDNSSGFYFEMSKLTMSHSGDYRAEMSNLTMSYSGDYRAEGWRGGIITGHTSFRLIVCAQWGDGSKKVSFGGSVKLFSLDSTLGHGSSLQLYRYDWRLDRLILVVDTNSSLEPPVEDLKGRLQLDLNTSLLTLAGVMEHDSMFLCATWRGAQCQSASSRRLKMGYKDGFTHEGKNVTLPCIAKREPSDQVYWTTPTCHVQLRKQTHPHAGMYMLDGSQTGDYSLIIPSVSLRHSGEYMCRGSDLRWKTNLYVCTKLSPLEVMFSPGQSVLLDITEHLNNFKSHYGIQWVHQKDLQPQALLVDFRFEKARDLSRPEDLRARVTVSTSPSNSSLIISNLTAEDSGVYTWRIYESGTCSEGTFHLVYMDPLGLHSPFYRAYAPLLGCGLLGLVTAVVWFKLRSRRGEQTSGCQSREGQQSGDDDLHDDLEMAELNTPPFAGAVEHSV